MSDTVPAAFLSQWIALQQQVTEGAIERSELRGEIRHLQERNDALKRENDEQKEKPSLLKQDYTELTKKYTELQNEQTELQAVNDALKRENEELKEENYDIQEEMKGISESQKNELEEAEKKINELTQAKTESAVLEAKRNALLDKYFNLSTCQCDLIGLYKYCKVYRVPEDVRLIVLAEDTRKELTLPDTLKNDVCGGSVREFLEWMVVPLPELKTVIGNHDIAAHFYVQYKKGIVPLPLLKSFRAGYGNKRQYNFTEEDLLTVTAVGTCLEYFTTVLPLLGGVTRVNFPYIGRYTLPEDRHTMIGGGSVGELLTAVVDLLPEPKDIKGFYGGLDEYYLAYKVGDISHDVLKAVCEERGHDELLVGTSRQLSAGISLGGYCKVMLPLLPTVYRILVGGKVDNINWCAALPERITIVNVPSCTAIKDFTPLLAMKGLRQVDYNESTNRSFKTIIGLLKKKGVSVNSVVDRSGPLRLP
ncbi:hypothetical protein AGDE_16645 [Angomonas deanei]|nr:hypothetical protein AGDE_16645 [Angomonas deanei]|eukprot:EPY16700.1 hypothetical protein AGDE_16645 [Angomonas deanei]